MKPKKKLKKQIEEYDFMLTQAFDDEIYATLLKDKEEIKLKLKNKKKNETN